MSPRGYLAPPDLAAEQAKWAKAEAGPKDRHGVAIDTEGALADKAQRIEAAAAADRSERGLKPLESTALRSSERGPDSGRERAGLQEKLRQLQRDLQEDGHAIADNKVQIEALQQHITSSNRENYGSQIRGFEKDNEMRLQRAAGYREQINIVRGQLAELEKARSVA
ncbi:MAG: hypothetical protein NTU97_02600 [Candidatus Magasanikbacteria bacterium]|nr:hypothetical protein [Candidatus Magasanikbacteria bacterium]